jgi:hypothetical protein
VLILRRVPPLAMSTTCGQLVQPFQIKLAETTPARRSKHMFKQQLWHYLDKLLILRQTLRATLGRNPKPITKTNSNTACLETLHQGVISTCDRKLDFSKYWARARCRHHKNDFRPEVESSICTSIGPELHFDFAGTPFDMRSKAGFEQVLRQTSISTLVHR